MKNYSEPIIELLALSPTDIIQDSGDLTSNDPYLNERADWVRQDAGV